VTLRLGTTVTPQERAWISQTELEQVVLTLAGEGRITNEGVRERIGLDRARVLSLLTRLVEDGRLVRHGQRRGTYYTLP